MNRFFSSAIFIIFISLPVLAQTAFYSKGNLDVTDLSNWSSTPDGTGPSPSNFSTSGQVFNVQANHSMTASGDWVLANDTVTNVVIKSKRNDYIRFFRPQGESCYESGAKWVQSGDTYSRVKFRYLNPQSIFQVKNVASFTGGRTYGTLSLDEVDFSLTSLAFTFVNGDFQLINGAKFSCSASHNIQILQDIKIIKGTFGYLQCQYHFVW
ncbi:MAG: hypothetical protein IPI12_02210 [Ignavibacteriales bacterium]|nr:hypothetical protein [Ignavibacteriales bacterium]